MCNDLTSRNCSTVRYLQRVVDDAASDYGLAMAAKSAMGVIRDVAESAMSPYDLDVIVDLVDELVNAGHHPIVAHLANSAPDCDICLALSRRLDVHRGLQ
jgi:hypothetical protein